MTDISFFFQIGDGAINGPIVWLITLRSMSVLGRYCVNEHYGIVLGERSLLSLAIIIAQETGS